jgi:hypothetical protein
MTGTTYIPLLAALVTASASILVAALVHLLKLISEWMDRRRHQRMHLMAIRNELVVNQSLAKAIVADTRTFGIRFLDRAWHGSDTSVIYRRGLPSSTVLKAYSAIQLFNTLCNRNELILASKDYGHGKEDRLAKEHAEMVELAEEVCTLTTSALEGIRT